MIRQIPVDNDNFNCLEVGDFVVFDYCGTYGTGPNTYNRHGLIVSIEDNSILLDDFLIDSFRRFNRCHIRNLNILLVGFPFIDDESKAKAKPSPKTIDTAFVLSSNAHLNILDENNNKLNNNALHDVEVNPFLTFYQNDSNVIHFKIDVDTGTITNWPKSQKDKIKKLVEKF